MKILIIRHAEPDYAIDSLTEKGWGEAELLSRRLAGMNIRDIFCSPLGRARDTAKPALERLGRQMEILPWLREFSGSVIHPFEGRRCIPWDLMPQYWTRQPALFDRDRWLDEPFMASGSVAEVYREVGEGLEALLLRFGCRRDGYIFQCRDNTADTIALFCHQGLGLTIISHLTGLPLPVLWHCIFLPPSSVTTLITEERMKGEVFFRCAGMGDTSHLYAAGEPVSRAGLFPEVYPAGR